MTAQAYKRRNSTGVDAWRPGEGRCGAVMIEMIKVTDSNRFTYNTETRKKSDNQGAEFSSIMQEAGVDADDTGEVARSFDETSYQADAGISDMEILMYTFTGRLSSIGKYLGLTLNIEV